MPYRLYLVGRTEESKRMVHYKEKKVRELSVSLEMHGNWYEGMPGERKHLFYL